VTKGPQRRVGQVFEPDDRVELEEQLDRLMAGKKSQIHR